MNGRRIALRNGLWHFWPPLLAKPRKLKYAGCNLRFVARSERQPIEKAKKVDFASLQRVDGNGANKAAGSDFVSAALKKEKQKGRTLSI
jgi:hypothetical protein